MIPFHASFGIPSASVMPVGCRFRRGVRGEVTIPSKHCFLATHLGRFSDARRSEVGRGRLDVSGYTRQLSEQQVCSSCSASDRTPGFHATDLGMQLQAQTARVIGWP